MLLTFLLALSAWAKEPKVQKFQEVERGLWLRSTFGIGMSLTNPFEGNSDGEIWPPGAALALEAGLDFGQFASVHFAVVGRHLSGKRSLPGGKHAPGDSDAVMVMLGARFNLATTKRLAWFIKAAAGYAFGYPDVAGLGSGLAVHGGTGIEYATQLRHFFIGIELCAEYLMSHDGLGLIITPTLKYTF